MTDTPAPPAWHRRADALMAWCLRHWLLLANAAVLLYGGLPWLAPLAHTLGLHRLGALITLVYRAFCHQRPDRSFFLNGYQVAFCQRETAMYTALLVGGLLFAPLRRRMAPAPLWLGGLLLLPMALDGGTHLLDDRLGLGWRGSDAVGSPSFWLRMLTGLLFALALLLVVYPRLERDLSRAA